MTAGRSELIHVAVGAVCSVDNKVLIAKRRSTSHLGGFWEFPGGKLEAGEDVLTALHRELEEELGIDVKKAVPLIRIHHDYPDFRVLLDVWSVSSFRGEAIGREGQEIAWVPACKLSEYEFPPANLSIVRAIRLPVFYAIVDEPLADARVLENNSLALLHRSDCLLRLRAKSLSRAEYNCLAQKLCVRARAASRYLLVDGTPEIALHLGAGGIHLTSEQLMTTPLRPLPEEYWTAASCHSLEQLRHAEEIGMDFAVLSPVKLTQSHPKASPIGWERFECWVSQVNIPVYALGGLQAGDLERAKKHGAQGVAGIRAFAGPVS